MEERTKGFGTVFPVRLAKFSRTAAEIVFWTFLAGTLVNAPEVHAEAGIGQAAGPAFGIMPAVCERGWIMSDETARDEREVERAAADLAIDEERLKLAKKLIEILGYERNYERRVDRAMALTYQALKRKYARNPQMVRILRDLLMEVRQDMLDRRQEYFDLMARLYAEGMDKDVLAAAVEFYSSSQGQAFLKQNAKVRKRAKAMGKEWVKSMMKQAIKDVLKKARERGVRL